MFWDPGRPDRGGAAAPRRRRPLTKSHSTSKWRVGLSSAVQFGVREHPSLEAMADGLGSWAQSLTEVKINCPCCLRVEAVRGGKQLWS